MSPDPPFSRKLLPAPSPPPSFPSAVFFTVIRANAGAPSRAPNAAITFNAVFHTIFELLTLHNTTLNIKDREKFPDHPSKITPSHAYLMIKIPGKMYYYTTIRFMSAKKKTHRNSWTKSLKTANRKPENN